MPDTMPDTLEKFASLFKGRTDAWGGVEGMSHKKPVTLENYMAHLAGQTSLGVYPLLDDGTCWFAAVDLDEKNWDKALLIRNELKAIGLNFYICQSKSKGYHIYGFGEPFVASEIRYVLTCLLEKLDITAEIFPKQDKLDSTITLGNYINVPCFGNTRPFMDADKNAVPVIFALTFIHRNTGDAVAQAKTQVPPLPVTNWDPVKLAEERAERIEKKKAEKAEPEKAKAKEPAKKKSQSPPCVERILKGVESGMRDEAAFALARHYLDQGDMPDEVTAMLLIWDAKNKPPIGDMNLLQDKVRSAAKGYAFGCNSITSGLLTGFCVGQPHCDFFKKAIEKAKKEGRYLSTSMYEEDDVLYEEIIKNPGKPTKAEASFISCNLKTGEIRKEISDIVVGETTYVPIYNKAIADGLVVMPTDYEEYGTVEQLMAEVQSYIHHYADFNKEFQEWAAWWVLMTWVYDRLPSVSYLRFLGDWGTGKSRALETVGALCYKRTKLTGALTAAVIYRVIDQYKGTLIIDENDMDNKSEIAGVMTKILNSGIERGSPIVRCRKEGEASFEPETYQVFGPKMFATRNTFEDMALESRCLTTKMQETTRPINSRAKDSIPFTTFSRECIAKQEHLRNQLLLFRFRHLSHVPKIMGEDDCLDMDLGKINGRLKQVTLPFATIFRDNPETMDKFKRFLERYQKEIYGESADSFQGRIVSAIFGCALALGKDKVTAGGIATIAKDEGVSGKGGIELSAQSISRVLKGLSIKVLPPQHDNVMEGMALKRKTHRYVYWDPIQMQSIYNRYQPGLEPKDLQTLGIHYEGPVI
jgi:hypothetical protein